MIIDAQHHCYVKGALVATPKQQVEWMEKYQIDMAVITNNLAFFKEGKASTFLEYNDKLFDFQKEFPDRFIPCPMVPIFSAKAAIDEFERLYSSKEAKTVYLQPYEWSMDYDYLLPFFERVNDLHIPIFTHPTQFDLPAEQVYGSNELRASIGFIFNTTIAVSRLILSGLLDTCPNLKFVIPHLGGSLPFLLGRLEVAYDPEVHRARRPPAEYLNSFYFDVVCYRKEALEFATSVMGPEKFLYATDYGCPGKNMVRPLLMKEFVEGLNVSRETKQNIMGDTLARLLKIEVLAK
jgi:aminocarboxymuconate-semialdehyde decarboxylase